ncbi:NAD-dependent epimerase/dehydratase family protein [Lysinibacillus pakistanensis]|uniref:NAD-dependent epimerase/dehydratase family protein n=1 Tax=Lysinibacillus pakistanensis TaxID=759811 RepID=UPI003D2A9F51
MILITGISSNTGTQLLRKLCDIVPSKEIVGIVRSEYYVNQCEIQVEYGDLTDTAFLESLYSKYSFKEVIHVANIRFSNIIMEISEKYNVQRNVLIHTTGIFSKYQEYNSLYNQIENNIFNTKYIDTSYVIVRPSMIYGNERDHNMHKLIIFLKKSILFPLFGDGKSLMQPVHVEDLTDAICEIFKRKDILNEDFNITGGSVLEYQQIIKIISDKLNKSTIIFKIPISLALLGARLAKIILRKSIITVEQIERLQEDKVYSHEKAIQVFNYTPRSFEQGIEEEIEILKKKGII